MRRVVDLKHVQIIKGADGKPRYAYFRRGKVRQKIQAEIGSVEFEIEVDEIRRGLRTDGGAPAVGTLGHAMSLYKAEDNPAWADLRAATKLSYQRAFDVLSVYGKLPLSRLTRPFVLKMRDADILPERGRWMANYAVTVLGVILRFALDRGLTTSNPLSEKVRKLRAPRTAGRANRPWTIVERTTVLERATPHVRLVLALFMCSGLRKADVFVTTMAAIEGGEIAVRTSKRDTPVRLPVHPLLADALKQRPVAKRDKPQGMQVALRADGAPWTPDGFDTVWHRFRAGLEADGAIGRGLTLHGLRHTLGTLLKEAGASDGDIADVLGQSGVAMARKYSREAGLPDGVKAKIVGLKMTERGTKL